MTLALKLFVRPLLEQPRIRAAIVEISFFVAPYPMLIYKLPRGSWLIFDQRTHLPDFLYACVPYIPTSLERTLRTSMPILSSKEAKPMTSGNFQWLVESKESELDQKLLP